ncbi:MAG TPA: MarR family winged helix-turn-helix transcriptional regulator [Gemmatimonadales bacterium]|nr:MarR family winged helix-turn-helix transcriptional regulator [Gemmatimonadales bacterium]
MTRGRARHVPQLQPTLDAIRRILRVLRRSSRLSQREYGVGSAQLFVLQRLADSPASSINELAERTYTHQSSVSVVVRRLVEQGLVVRRPAMADRRRRELKLTAAGKRLAERAPAPGQVLLIEALRALSGARLRSLEQLLTSVVRGMGAADEHPEMLFSEETSDSTQSRPRPSGRRHRSQKTSRGRRKTRPATPSR